VTELLARKSAVAALVALGFGALVGCGGPPYRPTPTSDEFYGGFRSSMETLEKRAPFDLKCPADKLTYKKLGDFTVGVSGCDQQVSYQHIPKDGRWVMDDRAPQ